MRRRGLIFFIGAIMLFSCEFVTKATEVKQTYPNIKITGAMRDVMWKGELHGKINLDTITNKLGLYGIGPSVFLQGEILINNGKTFLSQVTSDSTMTVEEINTVEAPFFVYARVNEWESQVLPKTIKTIKDLEDFIDNTTIGNKRPFAFKLVGIAEKATIHVQNLPKGAKVSSPQEAHQGQVNYSLKNENVEIIGFFSTAHQGVFTHHDSFLHLHLITENLHKMGHLDSIIFKDMTLFLPKS